MGDQGTVFINGQSILVTDVVKILMAGFFIKLRKPI